MKRKISKKTWKRREIGVKGMRGETEGEESAEWSFLPFPFSVSDLVSHLLQLKLCLGDTSQGH